MLIILTETEREALDRKYTRAYGERGVSVIGPTVTVQRNGSTSAVETFTIDEAVTLHREDPYFPNQPIIKVGTIARFYRIVDRLDGLTEYAVVIVDDHGQRRQYRVRTSSLQKSSPQSS